MRSKTLDLVKFIYMMVICFWHTGWIDSLFKGYSPVEFFFISAGFFLCRSSERGISVTDYMISRLRRLYPAFLISIIVYAIFLNGPYKLHDFLYEVSLMRDVVHIAGMNSLNRVVWFISVLFWGGLLVMTILKITKNTMFLLIASLTIYIGILIKCGNFDNTFVCLGCLWVPFWRGVAGLLLGVVVSRLTRKIEDLNFSDSYIKVIGAIGILLFCLSILLMFLPYNTELLSLSCYCVVILSCMICDKAGLLKLPQLPDITYEMFLMHLFVIKVAVKLLYVAGLLEYSSLKYTTFVIILLVLSYLLNSFIKYLNRSILKMF